MTTMPPRKPALLLILDGFGCNPDSRDNAIAEAGTPHLDRWFARYPHTTLDPSGRRVGLPDGQMGNSEVGHITLGAGAIMRQYLVRIDDAISDGSLFANPALTAAAARAAAAGRPLHLVGLVSDGGVHSHLRHLLALIDLAHRAGAVPAVHMLTDGRDTAPRSARTWLPELEAALAAAGGHIATVCGRYYAMDRDQRWERTAAAFAALTGDGGRLATDAAAAIATAYEGDEGDEFIHPTRIDGGTRIAGSDPVIFFNFRNDRPRQLTAALAFADFDHFPRPAFAPAAVTTLTDYGGEFAALPVAFGAETPQVTLGQCASDADLGQFRCAETEKYAHVTFFLNGGREAPYPGEERLMVPSPKVASYDLQPEMNARQVADALIEALGSGRFGLVIANFANGDMVGHTAVHDAVVAAVRVLDREVDRVLQAAEANGFAVLLTADHGNCELMVDPHTGAPHTQHTTFPVPCLVVDGTQTVALVDGGGLADVAPTLLDLMGLPIPAAMMGRSLRR